VARYIVAVEPLAAADVDEVVAVVSPVIERYLGSEKGRTRRRDRPV
jgi:hypothetical protein